jgi:hypothetical protein
MPKTGKNAKEWDSRDHTFKFVTPVFTEKFGVPNACNNCHKDHSTEWVTKSLSTWGK